MTGTMKLYRTNYGLRATAVMIALTAALLGAWKFSRETEPPYLWIKWLGDDVPFRREMAVEELGRMGIGGKPAVATLADVLLSDPDPGLRNKAVRALVQILSNSPEDRENPLACDALVAALHDPDAPVRVSAAGALAVFRPKPGVAVSALLAVTKDKDEWARGAAISALVTVVPDGQAERPEVVAAVVSGLNDSSVHVRQLSFHALDTLLRKAPNVVTTVLRDPARGHSAQLRMALGSNSGSAAAARPGLVLAMDDPDPEVRALAVELLSVGLAEPGVSVSIGRDDRADVIPRLCALLKDPSPRIRLASVRALSTYGGFARSRMTAIRKATRDEDAEVARAAVLALEAIDRTIHEEKKLVAYRLSQLQDTNPAVRYGAIEDLRRIGPSASTALAVLARVAASDPEPSIRNAALRTQTALNEYGEP